MDQADQIGFTVSSNWRENKWFRITIVAALVAVALWLTSMGLAYRRDAFERTKAIRYDGDVSHGFGWGQVANRAGLFSVYHSYATGKILNFPNVLDYAPLRMTVMYWWARWAKTNYPDATSWRNDYDLTRPVLMVNATAEWVSSILVFLLIRMWVIRMDDAHRIKSTIPSSGTPGRRVTVETEGQGGDRPFRGVVQGFIGACMFWFNPAVVWDGSCFPQWDIWLAPFFLGALLLSCMEWWFAAGCCVAVAAFLKAQILLVAPIFLIWPLFQLRWQEPLKFICGFVITAAVVAFPWMIPNGVEIGWVIASIVLLGISAPFVFRLRFLPLEWVPHIYAFAIAVAILLIPLHGGSMAWYTVGFEFGTKKFMEMASHNTTFNLPWIMVTYYRWPNDAMTNVMIPGLPTLTIRSLMLGIYGICLLACGIGAAVHHRRNDARFLAAFVAPWLCWFVLLTQLNNRYLVWAAGFSALLPAVGLGMTLLGMIVSFIGWMGIAVIMYGDSTGDPVMARQLRALTPHMTWPLLLAAAIYLWIAIAPRRLQQRQK